MNKASEFTQAMQDMMSQFKMDGSAFRDVVKNSADLTEKMSKIALNAAEKSTEISAQWTKTILTNTGEALKFREEPAEISQAFSQLASNSAELGAEKLAAFAEIAKKAQMETIELMLSVGKEASDDLAAATQKVAAEAVATGKKAAAQMNK